MEDKYTILYIHTSIKNINFVMLEANKEYFVIKDFAGVKVMTTAWFNGIKFDSDRITHVLIEQ